MSEGTQARAAAVSGKTWISLAGVTGALLAIALLLAWISTGFQGMRGWGSFALVTFLGAGTLVAAWQMVRADAGFSLPAWLGRLVVGAALLRIFAGAIWFVILPIMGHGTEVELHGYVMADAFARDTAAWELARSSEPLWTAFRDYRQADQYGGLLYLSASIYRYLGSEFHQPLLMVVVTASFSAAAVIFTWAFARRSWGEGIAGLSAWLLAVYPEAVLLGSSQMREAFTMTLVAAAFYGLARYWQERSWSGLGWVLGASILSLPFSPAFTALLLAMLAVQSLFFGGWLILRQRRLVGVVAGLAVLVAAGLWLTWGQIAPQGTSNPLAILDWWIVRSAEWQAYLSERSSGWIQEVFRRTPGWMNLPFLLAYGVVRPFLPAALAATSEAPVWQWISIWRSLGWALLLPFLLYAPAGAVRKYEGRLLALGLSLVVWSGILIASFRGGGDMWDNPRYRVAFSGLQVALVAWVWYWQRRQPDPWLRRILVGAGIMLVWFLLWYMRRYYPAFPWPVEDLFITVGLGVASAVLYFIWDWARGNPA